MKNSSTKFINNFEKKSISNVYKYGKEKGDKIVKNKMNGLNMYKSISIAMSLVFLSGCASTMENKKLVQVQPEPKTMNIVDNKVEPVKDFVKSDDNTSIELSKEKSDEISNEEKVLNNTFKGEWIAEKSSNFLQRKISIEIELDNFAKGTLELLYLSTDGAIISSNKFDISIYIKGFETSGYVKDAITNKKEEISIVRDSENEIRILPKETNSLFFENGIAVFRKILLEKDKEVKKEKVVEFRRGDQVVIEVIDGTIWQDTKSTIYLKSDFDNAINYCSKYSSKDYNNWRLPTKEEISKTYDVAEALNYIFENNIYGCYWTNEESLEDRNMAWCFDYKLGKTVLVDKNTKNNIRCVTKDRE